jgi:hypothetical protein
MSILWLGLANLKINRFKMIYPDRFKLIISVEDYKAPIYCFSMKLLTVARGLAVFGGLSKAVALLNENTAFETVDDVPIEADYLPF